MDNFDLKKYIAEGRLYKENPISLDESVLQDMGAKIKPSLDKVFSVGKSKSKQVYDIVKKEVSDPENAKKALDAVRKVYDGIKNVANKATDDPNKLRDISKLIPSLKNTALGTVIGASYQIISGTGIESSGFWGLDKSIVWGDPSTALNIGIFLVVLKLIIYSLQAIANIRKGASAIKGLFNENEEEIENIDFSDIKKLFESNNI